MILDEIPLRQFQLEHIPLFGVRDGLESIHFSQDEPGVYMDLGEWEGVFRANENHWLGFKVL